MLVDERVDGHKDDGNSVEKLDDTAKLNSNQDRVEENTDVFKTSKEEPDKPPEGHEDRVEARSSGGFFDFDDLDEAEMG